MEENVVEIWNQTLAPYKNYRCILGCSGGIDSMVMLHFLIQQEYQVHVVHVNYHKRGVESDKDEQFVTNFCANNSIPISCFDFEITEDQSSNFQEAARDYRYSKFEEVANNYELAIIVLAHHSDDQIETFFMNLARNAGVIGLAAIPIIHKKIVRPMLSTSKNALVTYAKKHDIYWREDVSNASNNYVRNRWRNEFIPFLEHQIPGIKDAVLTLVHKFQELQSAIFEKVNPIYSKIQEIQKLKLNVFKNLNEFERFELWRQLEQPSGTFSSFEKLAELEKGKQLNMIGEFAKVIREEDYLYFQKSEILAQQYKIFLTEISKLPTTFSKEIIYLDATKIVGEIQLRSWKDGDRIKSIGMSGSQLISDIVKDAKIPHYRKHEILVLCDDKEIHWVVGLKVGRNAIATSEMKSIVEVKLIAG